ncbi:uncharacterized protein LOC130691555 [Daphnia carinata]|uniref:uncharacterized protein LOC130691555 n=1 Tax=Daphnia carinata TaxID=120202 RepID=UPI00257B2478|nr:uncharacterized protein LOC130691555 [Daphnia carinata]
MAYRRERSPTSAVAVCIALLVVLMSSDVCKSQPIRKPPVITYVAGPNQLTLLFPSSAFRFGYDTNNQFRAERRFANGTVAGYYGYMRADGNPVRVKYGDVDNLGFSAIEEIIPVTFPPTTTEANTEEGSGSLPTESPAGGPSAEPFLISDTADKLETFLVLPKLPVVDDEKESVSVDAADFFRSGGFTLSVGEEFNHVNSARFVFPKIDVPDLPPSRKSRSIPRPIRPSPEMVAEDRSSVVIEQLPGEPAIIYKEPARFKQTASIRYTLN